MKILVYWLIGLTTILSYEAPTELAGTWERTLTIGTEAGYIGFDLDVARDNVSGEAVTQLWGYSAISDGHVEGDQFWFTVDHRFNDNRSVEKIKFTGAVAGKRMTLAMIDDSRHEATLHRVESQVTAPLTVNAPPKELEGEWTARFVGRLRDRPKMFNRVNLNFHVEGNTLTGMAHMGNWPGDCLITQGRVENGRFSFTASGVSPSSSGILMRFEGETHGTQLKLTMRHQMFGADNGVGLPMDG
jgi:hypothetical protein